MSLAHQIIPTGEHPVPSLIRYDAACRALAEAKSVDDVKDIRDRSEAMRAYAKQAKNQQLEVDAAEIRIRAERRLGQMIEAQKEAVGLNQGGRPKTGFQENPVSLPTLAEAGIDKNLANRARKMAAIPEAEFGEIVSEWRGRVEKENERVSVNLLKSGERHEAKQKRADTYVDDEEQQYNDLQNGWNCAAHGARVRFLAVNDLQFRAKVSEDNGSITGKAGAVAGEVSRVDAGRTASEMDVTGGESAATIQRPAAPIQALSKVDQVRLLRPHCQHPGTDLCGGSGRNHCHACKKLMAEGEAA